MSHKRNDPPGVVSNVPEAMQLMKNLEVPWVRVTTWPLSGEYHFILMGVCPDSTAEKIISRLLAGSRAGKVYITKDTPLGG